MGSDLQSLQAALAGVEADAGSLPWAAQRPWTTATHVWLEGGLPVVDLHDLTVKTARAAVDAVAAVAGGLDCGAVLFITGRGRHSLGPARLGRAVAGALGHVARREGWYYAPAAPGRIALVMDASRAPPAATSRLGWGFWLGVASFGVILTLLWPPAGPVILAALLLLRWLQQRDQGP